MYVENGQQKTCDDREKEIVFYLSEQAIYQVDKDLEKRQLSLRESVLNLLNILLILKASVMTRIYGSGDIGRHKYIVIPIGGKSVFAAGQTFTSQIDTLIKQLKKESKKRGNNNELLEQVYTTLESLMSSADICLPDLPEESSYLQLRKSFTTKFLDSIEDSFDGLLDFAPLQTGYINGSLLVVPVVGKKVEEKYIMRLKRELIDSNNDLLLSQMHKIRKDRHLPENIRSAMKQAIDLVNLLKETPYKTQRFDQETPCFDHYYAFPLFTFISGEAVSEYFANNNKEPEDQRFRDILENYLKSIYPVTNILPIGHKYKDFPFLVFRSYSFNEMRSRIFTDKYLLSSNELNILNLILYERLESQST